MNNLPAPATPEPGYEYVNVSPEQAAPATTFHVRKLLAALRKYWWVPVLTLVLSLGAAAGYVLRMQPTFSSEASIWEAVKMRLPGNELFSEDEQSELGTLTQVIRSKQLRERALARLETLYTNGLPRDPEGTPLAVELTVSQVPKSSVILVGASSPDPVWTRAYLDSVINVFLEFRKTLRKDVSGDTLASISEQVAHLEQDLKDKQAALLQFEQSNNLAILQEEASVAGSYLVKLQTQLSDYKLEAQLLDATALGAAKNEAGETNSANPQLEAPGAQSPVSTAANGGDVSAFQQLEQWKLEREKLSHFLRPKHPKIVKLDAAIAQAQKLAELYRAQNRTQNLAQIAASRQSLKVKADSVKDSIVEWEDRVIHANARVAEADRLKMNVARSQTLYDRFMDLLQSVDVSRNIDQASLTPLEHASPAERSYKHEASILGLALMGGLAVGLGIVFLIGFRDDRFTSISEMNALGDAVVGSLPEMTPKDAGDMSLLEPNDPRYMYAESYRNLRSALLYFPVAGERPKVMLITSAVPNEGKSTIAANLARTLALGGSRVLLVDADLRKGRLHEMLGMQCEPGLVELLRQPDRLDSVIQKDSVENFAFLSHGKALGYTSDLFLSPAFDQILARLREQYDYIILDSSPVFAADDASTLAPKADGTLFVVRGNFSSSRQVREGLELLHQRQSRILGLVFNRADTSARSYHYYNYAGYNDSGHEPRNGVAKLVE